MSRKAASLHSAFPAHFYPNEAPVEKPLLGEKIACLLFSNSEFGEQQNGFRNDLKMV